MFEFVRFDGASWRVVMIQNLLPRNSPSSETAAKGTTSFADGNGALFNCALFLVKFVAVHDHGKMVLFSLRRLT